MLRWFAVALLLAVPGAQACMAEASVQLDFDLPGECRRGALDACPLLPEADVPVVHDGWLVWTSRMDEACSAGAPSSETANVALQGIVRSNVGWLDVRADPAEVIIPVTEQYDLQDDAIDPLGAGIQSQERYPVRVTISLVGEPSEAALAALDGADGAVTVMLAARMGATGQFVAAYDVQSFVLDGRAWTEPDADEASRLAPGPSPTLALGALAGLAVLLRRR